MKQLAPTSPPDNPQPLCWAVPDAKYWLPNWVQAGICRKRFSDTAVQLSPPASIVFCFSSSVHFSSFAGHWLETSLHFERKKWGGGWAFKIVWLDGRECWHDDIAVLQSWTKVLGRWVLQYSYFSLSSRLPLKTVHPFRNSLAVLPFPTLYKVETRKKFWIHASNIVCGVGLDLCELENAPETEKCPKTFVDDCRSILC